MDRVHSGVIVASSCRMTWCGVCGGQPVKRDTIEVDPRLTDWRILVWRLVQRFSMGVEQGPRFVLPHRIV
jgi:hypothetical protein